jgi:hypothetical protein
MFIKPARPCTFRLQLLDECPRFPGFPSEIPGVGALHADFLNEIRRRRYVPGRIAGNPIRRKRTQVENDSFSNAFTRPRKKHWRGFARRFRPMYAWANMGHPSRGWGFVFPGWGLSWRRTLCPSQISDLDNCPAEILVRGNLTRGVCVFHTGLGACSFLDGRVPLHGGSP